MALLLVCVGVNAWWIYVHLRGMPFDIDAAGYLQRAIRDEDALRSGGLGAYVRTVRTPGDIQAPLLTALGGFFQGVAGIGVLKLTELVQLFYAVLVVSTYAIARRVLAWRWSLLAALVVACIPAVLQTSRDFDFSVPAAALVTAALALQLHAEDFRSPTRSLAWGAMLGLASLTRTMTLALLPVLVIVAIPRLVRGEDRLRRLLHAVAGLVVGVVVAGTWYTATWRAVLHYLVSYGYGPKAASYGAASSWLSWSHWTARANLILNEDVFLPLALALVAGALAGSAYALVRRARGRGTQPTAPRAELARTLAGRALSLVASDVGALLGVVVLCYVVLSSTQNLGSYFELPLLPAAVVLLLWLADHASGRPRALVALACAAASVLSFANQAGWILGGYSDVESVQIGPMRLVAFDGRSTLIRYASAVLGGCPGIYSCISPELRAGALARGGNHNAAVNAYLRAWEPPVDAATRFVEDYSRAHGRYPVLFFAVQDPFFNTNTVALEAQIAYGDQLPIGILQPPSSSSPSYADQLGEPQYGEPNFVIAGPLPGNPYSAAFSPDNREAAVVAALRRAGFAKVDDVTLPDHRVMGIWWKERGAVRVP